MLEYLRILGNCPCCTEGRKFADSNQESLRRVSFPAFLVFTPALVANLNIVGTTNDFDTYLV